MVTPTPDPQPKMKGPDRSRKRRWAIDLIRASLIALACLFLAELGLRVMYPEKVLAIAEGRRLIEQSAYAFDPDRLVRLKPNVTKRFERKVSDGGEVIRWATNGAGFRGPELRQDPETRIIVYGDSNMQARFTELERTFPFRLEALLREGSGQDIEVINAGLIGAGPDQYLIRLPSDIDAYEPDIVVFHVFADNDHGDLVRNRLFELDENGGLKRVDLPVAKDPQLTHRRPRLLIVRAARRLLGLSAQGGGRPQVADDLADQYLEAAQREYAAYLSEGPRVFSHFTDHYDIDLAVFPDSASSRLKTSLMGKVLERANRVATDRDVVFVVLIQPSSRDLTKSLTLNHTHLDDFPDYRPRGLTDAVEGICAAERMHCVNLFSVFEREDPSSLFFPTTDHWNDTGQERAAQTMAHYILGHFLKQQ